MLAKILVAKPSEIAGSITRTARLPWKLAILSCLASALTPLPASACSGSWTSKGKTAEERMAGRTDVRRIIGIYRIEHVLPAERYDTPARILGRVETKRGTTFRIAQPYRQEWVDCLFYRLPMADASGTFYIARRDRNGRYELLDWSGEYIPGNALESGYPDPQGQQ